MRRYLLPLFAANMVAFAAVGLSYFIYSRLLTAQQFGAYAAALAVGNLAVLVLDGGIKTSIIKHTTALNREEESSLLTLMLGFSAILLIVLFGGQRLLGHVYPGAASQTEFVAAFAAVYLITYPWIGLSTASLERQLSYGQLAWIESIGIVVERGVPAAFLVTTGLGLWSFVVGLALGRIARIVFLHRLHRVSVGTQFMKTSTLVRRLIREGLAFQLGGAASLIRDNLHVIVVGPLYGTLWVGYYAWGLQLCTIASQVFVQIAARVSLSVTARALDFPSRWAIITQQIALLTAATAPILAALVLSAATVDYYFFAGKWQPALAILPFLCARMIPGIASTPVGTLLLVERGSARYARALWLWTGFELAVGYTAVKLLGPLGLAVSYSVAAWFGVRLLLREFRSHSLSLFWKVCSTILTRPGLWLSVVAVVIYLVWIRWSGKSVGALFVGLSVFLVIGAYLVDPGFWLAARRSPRAT
jgi:O-antigen/teichoic acid export membrane protein